MLNISYMGKDDILKSKLRGYHFADTKSSNAFLNCLGFNSNDNLIINNN